MTRKRSSRIALKNEFPHEIDGEIRNEEYVDDISKLFDMGFISIEEVDTFDAKKFREQEGLVDHSQVSKAFSPREDFALQCGWTVSSLNDNNCNTGDEEVLGSASGSPKIALKKKAKNPKNKTKTLNPPSSMEQDSQDLPVIEESDLMDWKAASQGKLHIRLLAGLKTAGFIHPTPIQAATLREYFSCSSSHHTKPKDLMASAPTGSGKTLAFSLPLLNEILTTAACHESTSANLAGLIVVPTRELALQIEKHLRLVTHYARKSIKLACVVGGMSTEKQTRQLSSSPSIVIATPGRLSELMEYDANVRRLIVSTKFLILDEADRMIQSGHFRELDEILAKILNRTNDAPPPQIFLFSATLLPSKDQNEGTRNLRARLQLSPSKVTVLDFAGKPAKLLERYLVCESIDDKEAQLFAYLLERRSTAKEFGRILVFTNAIESIRRLVPLFGLLGIPCLSLHAQMQQRQRLKSLDRFKQTSECCLIASDVAARGLDIADVDEVVHFHLPKSRDIYLHRCGRTARAQKDGLSLALIAPEDRKLAQNLGIFDRPQDVRAIHYDPSELKSVILPAIKLARKIESLEHSQRSAHSQITWAERTAQDLDIILDEDNDPALSKRKQQGQIDPKALQKEISFAKEQLARLLNETRNI